jgi:hypothetical protein
VGHAKFAAGVGYLFHLTLNFVDSTSYKLRFIDG